MGRLGPDGLAYWDLASPPEDGVADPGVRLLPEYDALLLAYAPAARSRFADPRAIAFWWNPANGVHSPLVLLAGRLRAMWRLVRSGGTTDLSVEMFPGERRVEPGDFTDQVRALEAVLNIVVRDVQVIGSAS